MISTVGVVALSNAATDDNKVEVIINYVPSAYVDMGYCWVEFDQRILDDNFIYGENDIISFSFFYDVAIEAWFGAVAPGDGYQTDYWFYNEPNNVTAGYTGSDMYNETRFSGWMDVILDGYDMGMSNFDVGADGGTYQQIPLQLDIGWHYLTITAAELVSDANHTEWYWDYSSDSKRFYVGETKDAIPPVIVNAFWNDVNVTANAMNSEDLPSQGYNITEFLDNPRPLAEADFATQFQNADLGVEDVVNVTTSIIANYNASDANLNLVDAGTAVFDNIYEMGPSTYFWVLNNGYLDIANDTYEPETLTGLIQGQNWVYFILYGLGVDDLAMWLGGGSAVPRLLVDVAIFGIWVGDLPESTGLGFGIFISVSILGLAAALYFVRRRK